MADGSSRTAAGCAADRWPENIWTPLIVVSVLRNGHQRDIFLRTTTLGELKCDFHDDDACRAMVVNVKRAAEFYAAPNDFTKIDVMTRVQGRRSTLVPTNAVYKSRMFP